jgi:Ion transport protein
MTHARCGVYDAVPRGRGVLQNREFTPLSGVHLRGHRRQRRRSGVPDIRREIEDEVGTLLTILNEICVGIFRVELAIRIAAYGRRPQDFFRDGWNVFDFVVILAAFAPGCARTRRCCASPGCSGWCGSSACCRSSASSCEAWFEACLRSGAWP